MRERSQYILDAAKAFCRTPFRVEPLGDGLIHETYRISGIKTVMLQKINRKVFHLPGLLIENYKKIQSHLLSSHLIVPMVPTLNNEDTYTDIDGDTWRAFQYVQHYPAGKLSPELANTSAKAFGTFIRRLSGIDKIDSVLPRFHDLGLRYEQFNAAITADKAGRKKIISEEHKKIVDHLYLVDLYNHVSISKEFRQRIMHHDAKPGNILFTENGPVIVDLDTCQPGYFFSDIGDLIRSMVPSENENYKNWKEITVKEDIYDALIEGYLETLDKELTSEESSMINYSGLIIIYMQALRFFTDFINGDIYYRIDYPDQNLDRGRNQLHLLMQLEEYLERKGSIQRSHTLSDL